MENNEDETFYFFCFPMEFYTGWIACPDIVHGFCLCGNNRDETVTK